MASFNKVLLLGNLTRDPELKFLPSQTPVAEFGIACNRKFRTSNGEDREEVTFVDVTAFGKQAEVISQYMEKGKPIFVEGRLKYDQWDDKNGGSKRSKITVVLENFQFIGGRSGGGDEQPAPRDDGDQTRQQYPRTRQSLGGGRGKKPADAMMAVQQDENLDADIPF